MLLQMSMNVLLVFTIVHETNSVLTGLDLLFVSVLVAMNHRMKFVKVCIHHTYTFVISNVCTYVYVIYLTINFINVMHTHTYICVQKLTILLQKLLCNVNVTLPDTA